MSLQKLNADDYLFKDEKFWKNYRIELTKKIKENGFTIEKTPKNIYDMAKKMGVKPTARYFNIEPCQVRYFIKKNKKNINKN